MSTSADGDGRPDNGPSDGVPDLPAEWGRIVIPDDPAELADEAAEVRRELRQQARREDWRRRLGLPSASSGPSPLRICLLVMSIALLATLTSLFAIAWPGQPRPVATGRTTPSAPPGRTLPALDLVGEDGRLVPLRGLLPAVIVLTDGCTCDDELEAAIRAVPPGITVVAVSARRRVPDPQTMRPPGAGGTPRYLTDPTSEIRGSVQLAQQPGTASALLVGRTGEIIRTVPAVTSVADYQGDLARLTTVG